MVGLLEVGRAGEVARTEQLVMLDSELDPWRGHQGRFKKGVERDRWKDSRRDRLKGAAKGLQVKWLMHAVLSENSEQYSSRLSEIQDESHISTYSQGDE